MALTTAIYAVILAISSLGGNNATKEMLLAQQQASDLWAHYQAKSIRENQVRVQKLRLEADLFERGAAMKPARRQKHGVRGHWSSVRWRTGPREVRRVAERVRGPGTSYNQDKKGIEKEAKALEHERDIYRTKDPYFDYGEALLQIAIVMASIAILSSSRPVFGFSLIVAVLGAIFTLNGFLLFFPLPTVHLPH